MRDVLARLRQVVGEPHVLVGADMHDDYTHDEAITV
jgi:hypothetical protein